MGDIRDAEAIIRAAQTTAECKEQINNILAAVKIIRPSLWNLRADVKEFQEKCNIAKTVGTGAGVTGAGLAIGILFKPSLLKLKRILSSLFHTLLYETAIQFSFNLLNNLFFLQIIKLDVLGLSLLEEFPYCSLLVLWLPQEPEWLSM